MSSSPEQTPESSATRTLGSAYDSLTGSGSKGSGKRGRHRHKKRRKQRVSTSIWQRRHFFKVIAKFRELSGTWVAHIVLIGVFIGFSVAGAFMFQAIEGDADLRKRKNAQANIEGLISEFYLQTRNRSVDDVVWRHDMAERMGKMRGDICLSRIVKEVINDNVQSVWTFPNAIYFCVCVFTTIGYGDFTPFTAVGKVSTIIYAFFGIPFWLTLVANFGNQMNYYVKAAMYYSNLWFYGDIKRDVVEDVEKGGKTGASPHLYVAEVDRQVQLLTTAQGSRPTAYDEFYERIREIDERQTEKPRSSFRIPIKIPLILMIIYIFAGALVLTFIEDWNYLDSTYFLIITLLTIGFGDTTVRKSSKFVFCVYVLVGMALFSFLFAVTFDSVENIMTKIKESLENERKKQWERLQNLGLTAFTAIHKETKTIAFQPNQLWTRMTKGLHEPEPQKKRKRKRVRRT